MNQSKILFIEDDALVREAYEETLRTAGYLVDIAVDGEQGLNHAKQGGYDLILLDIMLPKLDGLGILRGLKANPPATPNGPIILLTNLSQDSVISEAIELGVQAALIKSDIDPGLLIEAVKAYLIGTPQAAAPQQAAQQVGPDPELK